MPICSTSTAPITSRKPARAIIATPTIPGWWIPIPLCFEAIRLNNRLNMSLTELSDQIIDVNVNPLDRKDAYLKSIQLTGVLNALSTRLIFMKINYDDVQTTELVNQLLTRCRPNVSSRSPMGYTPPSTPKTLSRSAYFALCRRAERAFAGAVSTQLRAGNRRFASQNLR